jgi:hypothetical protein
MGLGAVGGFGITGASRGAAAAADVTGLIKGGCVAPVVKVVADGPACD